MIFHCDLFEERIWEILFESEADSLLLTMFRDFVSWALINKYCNVDI